MNEVLGIDFGTSYIRCAMWQKDSVRQLSFSNGDRKIPAYLTIDESNQTEFVLGRAGKDLSTINSETTLFNMHSFIGKSRQEGSLIVEKYCLPFEYHKYNGGDGNQYFTFQDSRDNIKGHISLQQAIFLILEDVKEQAEQVLGKPITNCAIATSSVIFPGNVLEQAASAVGFKQIQLIPALDAIIVGCLTQTIPPEVTLHNPYFVVVDLGAFKTRILAYKVENSNKTRTLKLVEDPVVGDGGSHVDHLIMQHCAGIFASQHNVNIWNDNQAIQRLRLCCEEAKIKFSSTCKWFDFNIAGLSPAGDLNYRMSSSCFENLCGPFVENINKRLINFVSRKPLNGAKYKILLMGGGSRMPLLRKIIGWSFPDEIERSVSGCAEDACAYGAAFLGGTSDLSNPPFQVVPKSSGFWDNLFG